MNGSKFHTFVKWLARNGTYGKFPTRSLGYVPEDAEILRNLEQKANAAPASVPESVPVAAPASVPGPKPEPCTRLLITVPVLGGEGPGVLRRDLMDYLETQWFDYGTVTVEVLP